MDEEVESVATAVAWLLARVESEVVTARLLITSVDKLPKVAL